MPTILIVDDDPRIRAMLDMHIEDAFGMPTVQAEDGMAALDLIKTNIPDLVLMDLSMPRMNGIQTIRELRTMPSMDMVPIIFLSAETDKTKWVEAFEAGANDFVPKPFQENELIARISTHLKLANLTRELERKNALMEHDRRLAENVQKQLLPSSLDFPGVEAAAVYQAQELIGGDFFDAWEHNGVIQVVLGDISGHGASAALLMAVCKGILSPLALSSRSPLEVVAEMNRNLFAMLDAGDLDMFVTLAHLTLDLNQGRLSLISCGHTPVYALSSRSCEKLPANGPAMGFLPEFDWVAVHREFQPGDIVFLYTDGLTELKNNDNELFGETRLEQLLRDDLAPREMTESILRAGLDFSGGKIADDVAMLAVKRT